MPTDKSQAEGLTENKKQLLSNVQRAKGGVRVKNYCGQGNVRFLGHTNLISCFWSCAGQFSLSYLTYAIRCNQMQSDVISLACNHSSACNHSVYTTCTQWLHHLYFGSLDIQLSAFCSLVPRPHPSQCILLFVHHFLSTLVFEKKKKKQSGAWSFLSDL